MHVLSINYHSTGDIFIVHFKEAASFLKLKSGNVTIPVVTQTEFALTPPNEEGNETDAAVRNWEGAYQSVTEFFKSRQDQCMPVPAVSVVHTTTVAVCINEL